MRNFLKRLKKYIKYGINYSFVGYKINNTKVINDRSYDKDYLLGKYGVLPLLKVIGSILL